MLRRTEISARKDERKGRGTDSPSRKHCSEEQDPLAWTPAGGKIRKAGPPPSSTSKGASPRLELRLHCKDGEVSSSSKERVYIYVPVRVRKVPTTPISRSAESSTVAGVDSRSASSTKERWERIADDGTESKEGCSRSIEEDAKWMGAKGRAEMAVGSRGKARMSAELRRTRRGLTSL